MLTTALAIEPLDTGARSIAWRQVIDILAQAGSSVATAQRQAALRRASELGRLVPVADRRVAAASIAARTVDADLVALFADDQPAVAAPVLAQASLSDEQWVALVPAMPAPSRNIMRNRRDLSAPVAALLARHAPADLALSHDGGVATGGISQIRELVERIEAFRARSSTPLPATPVQRARPAMRFAFETTKEGIVDWVEGVSREPLIGVSIAEPARAGDHGVDGQAAGAWRRRAPFTDARLSVAGSGAAGGDWLVTAAPLFNPNDGRFWGYRGEARRPRPDEQAAPVEPMTGSGLAPDSLRQLVHELRTPLNAILGFAEMIDRQMLGPAAEPYRARAGAIVVEAARVLAVVDDLDTAARLDTGRMSVEPVDCVDATRVLRTLVARHAPLLASRSVKLAITIDPSEPSIAAASLLVERLYTRLLTSVTAVAETDEQLAVVLGSSGDAVVLQVARPARLAGRDERTLLDPSFGPDGDWPDAPLLGLGFTLRLIGRLAQRCGGDLIIWSDRFELRLPAENREDDDASGGAFG